MNAEPITRRHTIGRVGRRGALSLLGAAALSPSLRAETESPVPQIAPAVPLPASPSPPTRTPGSRTPARRSTSSAGPVDAGKIYYVFFTDGTEASSMRTLRGQLASLVEGGVQEINLVINSPGGSVSPAVITYGFIRSLPVRINTHAQGFVQSAANILFLAGQVRSADRYARFMFHPSQVTLNGSMTHQEVRDEEMHFAAFGDMVREIYTDRTTLPAAEVDRFSRSEVIYTAEQARGYGVVQEVADLRIPGDQAAKILFIDRDPTAKD